MDALCHRRPMCYDISRYSPTIPVRHGAMCYDISRYNPKGVSMTAFAIPNQRGRRGDGVRSMTGRHRRRGAATSAPGRLRPACGPRRHPRGDPRAARRAADARLPDHPGARRADRRRVAAEPRLGLSHAAAARGRGPCRETASDSGKRVYELTDAGREQAAAAPAPWTAVADESETRSSPCATSRTRCSPRPARSPTPAPRPSSRRRRSCSATPGAPSTGCSPRRT